MSDSAREIPTDNRREMRHSSPARRHSANAISPAIGFAKFDLGDELGRGGMGIVSSAYDRELQRDLAIKILGENGGPHAVAQFIVEARVMGQLEHPNIVPVHEIGLDAEGRPWLAMKRVRGRSLRDSIDEWKRRRARLTAEGIVYLLEIFRKIGNALAFAHSRGVIHRDLKPANVMLGEFGEVLVMDWGLARTKKPNESPANSPPGNANSPAEHAPPTAAHHTRAGDVFGTPAYMAPEQAMGDVAAIDERTDIFALGGILYQMLTLETPHAEGTLRQIIERATRGHIEPPTTRAPWRGIPRELAAIAMKAMARERENRYPSVREFMADIAAYLAHRPTTAYRPRITERIGKWARRNRAMAAGLASAAAALAIGTVGTIIVWQQAEVRRQAAESETYRLAAQAEAHRRLADAAIRDADQARWRALVQAGKITELRHAFGLQLAARRSAAIDQFHRRMRDAAAMGKSQAQLAQEMPRAEAQALVAAFEESLQAYREHGDAIAFFAADFFALGLLYQLALQEREKAIAMYDAVLARDPSSSAAHANRGTAYFDMGRYAEAIADFTAAVEVSPNDVQNWINRANAHAMSGNHERAVADCEEALRRDARSAVALATRGRLHADRRDLETALEFYDRAIRIAPNYEWALANRADALFELADDDGALSNALAALAVNPRNELAQGVAGLARGRMALKAGDHAAAKAEFTAVADAMPSQVRAWVFLGIACNRLADWSGAVAAFDRALALSADLWAVWADRGVALAKSGRPAEARESFAQARRYCPPNRRERVAEVERAVLGGDGAGR